MNNKKIMFKFTAIISFSIVIMLIFNICMPLVSTADGEEEINIQINYNSESGTINAIGNINSIYTGYELYWVKGEVNFNSSSDANEVINWFKTNKIQEDIQNTLTINNTLSIAESGTYTVLCIAKINEQISMLKWVSKTITKPQEIENTIKLDLSSEGMKINIKVTDSAYDIKTIKIAKSDTTLLCKDFETIGENISFTGTREVNTSKDVESAGQYFVFVENSAGAQYVNGIIIKGETENQNTIVINIVKLSSDNKTVHLNINSENTQIKIIKYEITESVIKDKDEVKNNGIEISTDANAISVSDSQLGAYISIYAEDETGAYRFISKNISQLESYDSLPWDEEYEEIPDEEENKNDENQAGNEEDKNDENQPGNQEQDKNDGNQQGNEEQDKNDENQPGNEEQNKNDGNQPENEEQDKNDGNQSENEEQDKNDENQPGNEEQDKNDGNQPGNEEQDKNDENQSGNDEQDKNDENQSGNQEQDKNNGSQDGNKEENTQQENQKPNDIPEVNAGETTIEKLPQTGSSKTETIIAMIVFAIIGMVSFINYKKIGE